MTREEKIEELEQYCNQLGETCDKCVLDVFNGYGCDFRGMDDVKIDKQYKHLKDLGLISYENFTDKSCNTDKDMVNHPSHYNQGGIECIDALKAAIVGKTGIEAFCVANAIKYLWRYEKKNGIEDVEKARWYIDRLIKELEANDE